MLMLGRQVTIPVDLMFPFQEVPNDYGIEQYLLAFIEKCSSSHCKSILVIYIGINE